MDQAISQLQRGFLTQEQIESSRTIMGLDTQLVEDGTYFVVEADGQIAGCGGWSRAALSMGATTAAVGTLKCSTRPSTRPGRGRCTPRPPSPAVVSAG